MSKKLIATAGAMLMLTAAFASNPLLTPEGYLKIDFTPAQMQEYTDGAQQYMDGEIQKILQIPAQERTFQNTIGAFERALAEYHDRTQFLKLAAHISTKADVRKKSLDISSVTKKYTLDVFTKKDLYAVLKAADKSLKGDEDIVAKKVLLEFEKNGMNLSEKDLAKFIKLKKEMIDLETAYDETLSNSKASLTLKEDELKGLSPTMIASMTRDNKGNYVLDITPRSVYFAFLASSEVDSKRKEAERNYQAIGGKKNLKNLEKMITVRQQIADLFKFDNYSDYVLQDKMAGNYETAMAFSADLVSKMQIKAAMENDQFLVIKREVTADPSAITLTEWDWRYYAAQYKKRNLNIDDEKIKEYFPTQHVVNKMLEMYGNVFNVKFEKVQNAPVWHESVELYAMKENGKVTGYIYMDTVPREGKYIHAECDDVIIYRENPDGSKQIPVAVLVSNASMPAGGVPSLLDTQELGTLFHEFGHGINFLFNKTPYGGLTSSLVWDFVEVPSKNLEYWAASPKVIKDFSKHYITGAGLDDATIKNMQKARSVDMGNDRLWFLTQVMFDLHIHANPPKNTKGILELWGKLNQDIRNRPMIDGGMRPAGFGHVAWGYASLYYGYDWSDIIAAEIFSVFDKKGLDSKAAGKAYRDEILSIGGIKDTNKQVEKFLGRKFNSDSYFKYMTGMDLGNLTK